MSNGHTQLDILGNNASVDPFGSNVAAALAYKKMEQLMTATYMVTNHVPDSESLRGKVRDISSVLLSDTIKLRDGFTSLGKGTLYSITAQVRLLLSLLDALYASGLISEMNLRVLKDAYRDFTKSLSAMSTSSGADGVELTAAYFNVNTETEANAEGSVKVPIQSPRKSQKKTLKSKSTAAQKPTVQRVAASASVGNRVSTIVDFLTKRGSASVGDIAQVITDCSSKTLQRDLIKLVAVGTLAKEGSKRWTRYSLPE